MNKYLTQILLSMTLLLLIKPCFAQIHQWTDSKGEVHFAENPPSEGTSQVVNIEVVQSNSAEQSVVNANQGNNKVIPKKIVMYGTAWCPYCKKARQYFNKKGLNYVEYDVDQQASKKREFKRLGGTGYPLIIIGKDHKMQGFSVSGFERRYNKQ